MGDEILAGDPTGPEPLGPTSYEPALCQRQAGRDQSTTSAIGTPPSPSPGLGFVEAERAVLVQDP
ncbi:hypothetical protein [Streptomyces sp. NPDC051561]|uniref:hypothetical protein n=1 Tax=Streptomyces sp. NPDC051561 TaxID=3365658 RepID=UPI0037AA05F9